MSEKDVGAELAALRAEVADLKAQVERAKPPAPINFNAPPTARTTTQLAIDRLSMSPQAMRAMVDGVPNVRAIFDDARASQKLAPLASHATPRVADDNKSGWRESAPLSNPPGVALVDRLCEAADAHDRAERIMQEARIKVAEKK